MGNRLKTFFNSIFGYIDIVNEKSARGISLLALVMIILVTITVLAKNFHITFNWGLQVNRQIFGVFILFGGTYAMLTNQHLRVEILHNRLSSRGKYFAGLIDLAALLFLMVIIIWQSGELALTSIALQQLTQGTPKIPLYTIKSFIPLISILILLQGISSFFRQKKPGEML